MGLSPPLILVFQGESHQSGISPAPGMVRAQGGLRSPNRSLSNTPGAKLKDEEDLYDDGCSDWDDNKIIRE